MQSNTKLNPMQKDARVNMRALFEGQLLQNGQTTVAYVERGNTVEFSLSVCSPDEKKFRRKVGEYHALSAFEHGETVKMGHLDFCRMMNHVFDFMEFDNY